MDLRKTQTFIVVQNGSRIGRPSRLIELGNRVGTVDGVECFDSIRFTTDQGQHGALTEASYEGPVSIRVRDRDGSFVWFAIASAATVANRLFDEAAKDRLAV